MSSQYTDRPVITENLISRTSVPNGCIGVCPETREIVLGAGFGYEPYRLYTDRFRVTNSLEDLKKIVNHDEGEIIVVLNERHFYFYRYHQSTEGWEPTEGTSYVEDVPADVGYWEFAGTFQIDETAQQYLKPPTTWKDQHFLIIQADGTLVDSGFSLQDFLAKSTFISHVNNTGIHVSQVEKQTWNKKQDALSSDQLLAVNSGVTKDFIDQLKQVDFSILDAIINIWKFDGVQQDVSERTLDIPLSDKTKVTENPETIVSQNTVIVSNRCNTYIPGFMYGETRKNLLLYGPGNKFICEMFNDYEIELNCTWSWSTSGQPVRFFQRYVDDVEQLDFVVNDEVMWSSTVLPDQAEEFELPTSVFINGQEVNRIVVEDSPVRIPYDVKVFFPERNAGYARSFLLWLDDPTGKGSFSLDTESNRFTTLPSENVDVTNLQSGTYRFTEMVSALPAGQTARPAQGVEAPDLVEVPTFLIEHLSSTFLLDKIGSISDQGSYRSPFKSPLHVEKNGTIYSIDIVDDENGIDLDINRVS